MGLPQAHHRLDRVRCLGDLGDYVEPISNRQTFWVVLFLVTWVTIAVFLTGCVHVGVTPDLPFPQAPALTFTAAGPVCLAELDAQSLRVYFDELAAYRQAIHRLHQAP